MIKVKITRTAISPVHGNMSPGDILTVSEAFAKHLVEDAQCAEYLTPPKVAETPKEEPKAQKEPKKK